MEVEGEESSSAAEVEGDDDEDDDGGENIDGGDNIALLLNEAHPRTADAVHLFSVKMHIELSTSQGIGVARERVSA